MPNDTPRGVDVAQVFREARGLAIAALVRALGDLDAAEDAVQEAFVAALSRWPEEGTPERPAAWIIRVAHRRAIDGLRREARGEPLEAEPTDAFEPMAATEPLDDDLLRLIFMCCHPSLAMEARVALTLRTVCGLTTEEVAQAFLVPESTVAQRIVRAKRKIKDATIPFSLPAAAELEARLDGVLAVIYLTYNAGGDAQGDQANLGAEGIRLARLLHALLPGAPEAMGLLGLLLLNESRRRARRDTHGGIVRLKVQDRSAWDRGAVQEGQALLRACLELNRPGPYQIQGAIQAVHADAATFEVTDWSQIVALYDLLLETANTPVVHLNRAIAVAELEGPAIALDLIADLPLGDYYLFHSTRGHFLAELDRIEEAKHAYQAAWDRAPSPTERAFLNERIALLASQ